MVFKVTTTHNGRKFSTTFKKKATVIKFIEGSKALAKRHNVKPAKITFKKIK